MGESVGRCWEKEAWLIGGVSMILFVIPSRDQYPTHVPDFGEMMWGAHMPLFFFCHFSWVYKMGNMGKKTHMGLQN